jgi:type IV secretory pathway VirB10-like protein
MMQQFRDFLDAVFPPAPKTNSPAANPVQTPQPPGNVPPKKRRQALVVLIVVVLLIGWFWTHKPAPQPMVVRNRGVVVPPTTTLTPEEVARSGQALETDTKQALQHDQRGNLGVNQFGNDPTNTGLVDPNAANGLRGNENLNPNTQPPYPTGPSPAELRRQREAELAKSLRANPYVPPTQMVGFVKPAASNNSSNNPAPPAPTPEKDSKDSAVAPTTSGSASALPVSQTKRDNDWSDYDGPLHRLLAGKTVLRGVMKNRLEGSYSGPVVVQITDDVYTLNRESLLLKAGTILVGTAQSVNSQWQSRINVRFSRVIMPDGFSQTLHDVPGLSQRGEMGVTDKVNRHYGTTFGAALVIGAVGGLAQIGNSYSGFGYDPGVSIRNGMTQSMGQTAGRVLEQYAQRPPTIQIREGTRVSFILADDVLLPEYRHHRVDPNL